MRKIAVITGTRAEYGLLYWLLKLLRDNPAVQLQLMVTGSHLSEVHGSTVKTIESDGFEISARVDMALEDDTAVGICRSVALAVVGFGEAFDRLQPDLAVVLGDRYEVFAAAQAAMISGVPIAHIHGGEATEGLIDEAIRHSISKMSHLHLVASEAYRNRVIQLGEHPDRVFNVGAPALDNIAKLEPQKKSALEAELDFSFGDKLFLITYHPVTLSKDDAALSVNQLISALEHFPDAQVLFTGVNADAHGNAIRKAIDQFAADNSGRVKVVESLGRVRYLNTMRCASMVIGNSSSGLIEAPAVGVPTVNIGLRQQGRLKAPSVIDCVDLDTAIVQAIETAQQPTFVEQARRCETPYGRPGASQSIHDVLFTYPLDNILIKRFYDQPVQGEAE